ncbi:hypothetical protein EYF80_058114 [Liparis tanakae]|uniref:Uncharacterized protein n=1 Tax=Liparis tanakae TaxID=230148 RepID=A0A4Z2ESE8_9TELE|nr:hypothetical protein EYF80_058114 [Liparis tanakae]
MQEDLGSKTQDHLTEDKRKCGDLSRQGLMREWATAETGMRTRTARPTGPKSRTQTAEMVLYPLLRKNQGLESGKQAEGIIGRREQAEVDKRDYRALVPGCELTIWQGMSAGLENIKPGA